MAEIKYKDVLADFITDIDNNPNLTDEEIFKAYPEFNNDKKLLDAAYQYRNTWKANDYDEPTLQSKFPEFFTPAQPAQPAQPSNPSVKANPAPTTEAEYQESRRIQDAASGATSDPNRPFVASQDDNQAYKEQMLRTSEAMRRNAERMAQRTQQAATSIPQPSLSLGPQDGSMGAALERMQRERLPEIRKHTIANNMLNETYQERNAVLDEMFPIEEYEKKGAKRAEYGVLAQNDPYLRAADNILMGAQIRMDDTKRQNGVSWSNVGNGIVSFAKDATRHLLGDMEGTLSFGTSDLRDAMIQREVLKKVADTGAYDTPEQVLTPQERVLYDAITTNIAVEIARQNDTSRWSKAGQITADMIPFIADIMAGNALFKGMGNAARHAITQSVEKAVKNKLAKWLLTNVGDVAVSAGESALTASILPRTYSKMYENAAQVDTDKLGMEGDFRMKIGNIKQQGMGDAWGNAYRDQVKEIFTETGGNFRLIGRALIDNPLGKKILKTPFGMVLKRFEGAQGGVGSRFASMTMYHGVLGEWLEELEGAIYDGNLKEFFTADTQLPMLLSFSVPAAFTGGLNAGQHAYLDAKYKSAGKTIDKLIDASEYVGPDKNTLKGQIMATLYQTPTENLPQAIGMCVEQVYPEEYKALMEGAPEKDNKAAELAYALKEYLASGTVLTAFDPDMLGGQIADVQAHREQMRQQATEAAQAAVQNISHEDGNIYRVTIKGKDDVAGYAFRGDLDVVPDKDGAPTTRGRDLITIKMDDGTTPQVPADELTILDAPQSAQERIEQMTDHYFAQYANNDLFHVGDKVYLKQNGQQSEESSTVVGINDEGIEVEIIGPDGQPNTTIIPHEEAAEALAVAEGETEDNIVTYTFPEGLPNAGEVRLRQLSNGVYETIAPDQFGNLYTFTEDDLAELGAKPLVQEEAPANTGDQGIQTPVVAQPAYPTDETGNPAWGQMEVPQSAQVLYDLYKGNRESAKAYADDQLKEAEKVQKAAAKQASHNLNLAQRLAEEEQNAQFKAQADAAVKYWEDVKLAIAQIKTAEELAAEQAQRDAMMAAREQRSKTEEGTVTASTMAERYNAAAKIEGNTGTMTLPDGRELNGRYMLIAPQGVTPSHDVTKNFQRSEGYPVTSNGQSINDRDYTSDQEEQQKVQSIAQNFNGNAIKNMPVISDEGLVYNGNGRMMAGQLAALNGTDAAYTQSLMNNAAQYGFTPEQVASIPNARVVFQLDERLPYSTQSLAIFNEQETQTQSNTGKAAGYARKLTPQAISEVLAAVDGFNTIDAFFSDKKAPFNLINSLINAGIIAQLEKAEMVDGDKLSATGRERLSNILFGTVFDNETIRLMGDDAALKNSILRALPQILDNKSLGEFSLEADINDAIRLLYQVRNADVPFRSFVSQTVIAEDGQVHTAAEGYTPYQLLLAEEMSEGGVDAFRDVLTAYNNEARNVQGGQVDIFGDLLTPTQLKNLILQRYGKEPNEQERPSAGREADNPAESTPASNKQEVSAAEFLNEALTEVAKGNIPSNISIDESTIRDDINSAEMDARLLIDGKPSNLSVTIFDQSLGSRGGYNPANLVKYYPFDNADNWFWEKADILADLFNKGEHTGKASVLDESDAVYFTSLQAAMEFAEFVNSEAANSPEVRLALAEAETDPNPTEAQKKAENYKQGHVTLWGLPITIENPKGSIRRGTDANGKKWEQEMHHTYGKIRRTEGVDGDHIDVFIGPNLTSDKVFVVDQRNVNNGEFDEHKVMLGFDSLEDAQNGYLSNYEEGWLGMGTVTEVTMDEFKKWIDSSHRKTKPFAEYKSVKPEGAAATAMEQPAQEQDQPEPVRAKHAFEVTIGDINSFIDRCANNYFKNYALNNEALDTFYDQQVGKHILAGAAYVDGAYILEVLHTANEELDKLKGKRDKYSNIRKRVFSNLVRDIQAGLSQPVSVGENAENSNKVTKNEKNSTKNAENVEQNLQESEKSSTFAGINNNQNEPAPTKPKRKQEQTTEQLGTNNSEVVSKQPRNQQQANFESNSVFTADAVAEARKRLAARRNRLNMGLNPEDAYDYTIIAGAYVEQGVRKFADFCKAMIQDLGDAVRPYLQSIYDSLRHDPQVKAQGWNKDFDSHDVVDNFDVDNFAVEEEQPEEQPKAAFEVGQKVKYYNKVDKTYHDAEVESVNADGTYNITTPSPIFGNIHMNNISEDRLSAIEEKPKEQPTFDSPMFKQFQSIKEQYPDAMLVFRVGDFYELYASDAEEASKILGITLTKRGDGMAFAGFPFHALDTYLPKLVRAGKRVAICDQLEDPKKAKKEVKRGVTELVTPGEQFQETKPEAQTEPQQVVTDTVGEITESKHTKTGAPIWVVKPMERVGDAEFRALRKRAKENNGYYSTFVKGYVFNSVNDANRFNNISDVQTTTEQGRADSEAAISTAEAAIAEAEAIRRDSGDTSGAAGELGGESVETGVSGSRDVELTPDQAAEQTQERKDAIKKIDEATERIDKQLAELTDQAEEETPEEEPAPTSMSELVEQAKKRQQKAKQRKQKLEQTLDLFAEAEDSTPALDEQTEPINTEDNGRTEVRNDGQRKGRTQKAGSTGQPADQNGTLGGGQRQTDEGTQSGGVGSSSEQHRVHDGERGLGTTGQPSAQDVERRYQQYVEDFKDKPSLPEYNDSAKLAADVRTLEDLIRMGINSASTQAELKFKRERLKALESQVPESERKNTRNFRYDPNDPAPTSNKARYDANMAAIRLLKQLQDEGRQATPEEQRVLAKFTGWGGLGEFFKGEPGTTYYAYNGEKSPYQIIKELLTDEELAAAQLSRNSAYYTPTAIIDQLWNIAERLGFKGGNILEGSAGIGNILAQMPQSISDRSNLQAVEIDDITAGILAQLYPDAETHHSGFEKVDIPNNSQDLVITNVPFVTGLRVHDPKEKDLSKRFRSIHDFCIAKNVRKLRQGGIGIFITTSGTLDNSKDLRAWLNTEGETDVIGAFRLNRETFGGTSATSDIIVVRKRVNEIPSPYAINVLDTAVGRVASQEQDDGKTEERKAIYNRYFVEHPEDMGGEMGFGFEHGDTRWGGTTLGCYPSPTINQSERLNEWVDRLGMDARLLDYEDVLFNGGMDALMERINADFEALAKEKGYDKSDAQYGAMVVDSKGRICKTTGGYAVPMEGITPTKVKGHEKSEVLKDYNALKAAVEELLRLQSQGVEDEGLNILMKKLNKVYDDFVKKYGYLNRNVSLSFLRNDVQWASMAALENVRETIDRNGKKKVEVTKTDVFSKRVVGVQPTPKADNAKDGVILSVQQYGNVRPDRIAEWLGKPQDEVEKEIIASRLAFRDPQTGNMVVSHEYLSGNVREKLAYAEEHNENGEYDTNIEELRKVIPVDIPAHLIEFNIGSTWIPVELYHEYLKEKFGVDSLQLTHVGSAWLSNEKSWGTYSLHGEKNRSEGVYSELLKQQIYGHQLMIAAMNNVPVVVSQVQKHYDGSTETITDKVATAACSDKISRIKDDFVEWARGKMQQDPELAERVQKIYNERFNAIVPMLSVDKAFLSPHLPGQNPKYTLYDHQQQAVVRGTTQPIMLAHEVGTGKTITLISTAMDMRRLGTAKKPMIVVQNATTPQFVKEAKDLYPNAKILTVSERDRTKEGRQEFYAKIKYNDWDLIIVPQSVFDMIPDSEARMRDFIQDKIDEKLHAIEAAKEAKVDEKVTKRMERELEALKEDLQNANMSGKKTTKKSTEKDAKKEAERIANATAQAEEMLDRRTDEVEDFDDMGIDALLIDEAHNYKHLGFATMMTRGVKGIDPSYSKRAAALFLKCQSIYDRKGHRNVVFATGTPISNTAAEIWTFMKYLMPKSVLQENDIYYFDDFVHNFGKIAEQLEFATNGKFKANNRFAQYGNVPELMRLWLTCADCVLTREVGQVNDKVPELEGGKAQDIFLPQSPSLIDIMASVRDELERYEKMSGKEKKENSHIPLTMYGVAKRAAIDPRLVDATAADEPLSKTNKAVEETLRSLKETKKYNGTVAIFCDSYRNLQSGFNLFEDIKAKLVKAGVPAAKVAIIRSEMTDAAKQKIFDAVREGEIRVIMGSTQTLGTGVNIQTRLHTLIHMDAPDRPMDYTQRNGRIIRQGNMHRQWNIPVRVLRFGVEDSLDVTSYQRLKTKAGFIDSIMNGKSMIDNNLENRVIEDVEEGLFDNPVAMLSGSQYALLKSQAERDLRKWQARKQQHDIDQMIIAATLKKNATIIEYRKNLIAADEKLLEQLKKTSPTGKVTEYNINGTICHTPEELKAALKEIEKNISERAKEVQKNSDYDYTPDVVYIPITLNNIEFQVNILISRHHSYKDGEFIYSTSKRATFIAPSFNITEPKALESVVTDKIIKFFEEEFISGKSTQEEINYSRSYIARLQQESELMRQREGKPFEHTAELERAQALVDEYTEKMKEELEAKEAKYANQSSGRKVELNEQEDEEESAPEAQIDNLDYPQFTNQTEAQRLATMALIETLNDNTDLDVFLATDEQMPEDGSERMRRPVGGNRGYVGYSKSVRAVNAEEEGKRSISNFDNEFVGKVNAILESVGAKAITIVEAKRIAKEAKPDEWHHTSMYGNKTNYYSPETIAYEAMTDEQKEAYDAAEQQKWEEEHARWQEQSRLDSERRAAEYEKRKALNTEIRRILSEREEATPYNNGYWINLDGVHIQLDSNFNDLARRYDEGVDKKAVKAMADKYLEDLRAEAESNIEDMVTTDGTLYGWAIGDRIYLTKAGLNPNTPIHEYTHLWAKAMRRNNQEGWQSIVDIFKVTPFWDEVVNDPNYQGLTTDDAICSEVLARYSGQRGAARMEEWAKEELYEAEQSGSVLRGAKVRQLINRAKKALADFWHWVGTNLFGIKHFDSAKQVADRVLWDMLNGTELDVTADREMQHIKERAIADGTFMKAPNGQPTNLNERQWLQVRTRAFKRWFGDWENDPQNASKVVDANGEPMVVYHGTKRSVAGFTTFEKNGTGIFLADIDTASWYSDDDRPTVIKGVPHFKFWDEVKEYAEKYDIPFQKADEEEYDEGYEINGEFVTEISEAREVIQAYKVENDYEGTIYACFLNIQNPKEYDYEGHGALDGFRGKEEPSVYFDRLIQQQYGKKAKYDGVICYNIKDRGGYMGGIAELDEDGRLENYYDNTVYIVPNPNQIKSATNNNGEFSEENDDIEMMISRYTPEQMRAIQEWNEAHPHPQYQVGEKLDHYAQRLAQHREAREQFRASLKQGTKSTPGVYAPKPPVESTQNTPYLGTQTPGVSGTQTPVSAPAFVPGVKPTPTADESPAEYAQRLRNYFDLMRDEALVNDYVAEINAQADAAAKVLKKNTLVRGLFDAAKPIENFQEWMKQRGATMTDGSNAYTDTFLASGRVSQAHEKLTRDILRPLTRQIAKIIAPDEKTGKSRLDDINLTWRNMDVGGSGVKIDGTKVSLVELVGLYCQAKDIAEAKEWGLPDRGEAGFKKCTSMNHEDFIKAFEARIPLKERDELWRLINAATHYALKYDYESGRITEDTLNEFYKRQFYVPQRGWRERSKSGVVTAYKPMGKRVDDPYNAALVTAHGRQSLAEDPFAYIMSIDASSIISSENNKIKQKFLRFCLDNEDLGLKTGAFRIKKYWIMNVIDPETGRVKIGADGNPMMEVSYSAPSTEDLQHDKGVKMKIQDKRKQLSKVRSAFNKQNEHGEMPEVLQAAYETKIARLEKEIEDLESQMHIVWHATNSRLPYRTSDERKQNEIQVMLDGEKYVIELEDEKLANAINQNFKDHQESLFSTSDKIRNATRFMSAMLTQYNPEFAASNFARDYQVALATLMAEHRELVGPFMKYFATCQGAVWKYAFNDKVRDREAFADSEMGQYLREYFASGAPTGFSYMQDLKSLRRDFDAMVNESNVRRGIKGAVGVFAMLTEVSETAVRFAGFVAARKNGMGLNEAAYLSKELTTNFDRAGEAADTGWMAWFSFFRATLNGNLKFLKALKKMPLAYSLVAVSYFAMGMLNQFLNPDDPDDEIWASDYTRQSNFVLGKIRVPVAHFMRMFFGAGVNAAQWIQGNKTFGHAVYNTATFASNEMLPNYLNLLGNGTEWNSRENNVDFTFTGLIQGAMPSPVSPITDVWFNRDFRGTTINREPFTKAQEGKKDILMGKEHTLPIYKWLTQAVYEGVGGSMNTEYKSADPAWRSWLFDISPSSVEHVVEGYIPAGADMFITLGEAIYDAATGTPTGPDKWPFVRKFYNAYTPERAYMQQYYLLNGRVKEFKRELKDYQKNDPAQYRLLRNSQQYRTYQQTQRLVKSQSENPTTADVKALIEANKLWLK